MSIVGAVALTLVLAALAAAALAGCGGGGGGETVGGGGETVTAAEAQAGDPERGEAVYEQMGCAGCHTFSGTDIRSRNVGPNLDLVAEKYDADFIREGIENPDAYVERGSGGEIGGNQPYGTQMPAYGPNEKPPQNLTEQQLLDLVAFIEEGGTG